MSEGPALFGAIYSFDVDAWGRIFVLDSQAEEVRIFDSGGTFVRTVGRRGEGPGEFTQAGSIDLSLNGQIWVMGMGEGRVSIFDTTGTYLRGERTNAGGMILRPYRGGFDPMGRYNVVIRSAGMRGMARFDQSFTPIDTIYVPENPEEGESFRMVGDDGRSRNGRRPSRTSSGSPARGDRSIGRSFRKPSLLRLPSLSTTSGTFGSNDRSRLPTKTMRAASSTSSMPRVAISVCSASPSRYDGRFPSRSCGTACSTASRVMRSGCCTLCELESSGRLVDDNRLTTSVGTSSSSRSKWTTRPSGPKAA